MHDPCNLQLIGVPALQRSGDAIRLGRKAFSLLAFLVVEDRFHTREALAEMLWPRASMRSGLHSLSQALYTIRRSCGPQAIETEQNRISIGRVGSDYQRFRRAIANSEWHVAAGEVDGCLCEGLRPVTVPFGHWLDSARTTLMVEVKGILSSLEVQFQWDELLRLSRLVKEHLGPDPECDRFEATAIFGSRELDQEWRSATGPADAGSVSKGGFARPFVGRTAEVARFSAVQERVERNGSSAALLVTGRTGIGKTTITDRLTRLAALRGWSVITARGYSAERHLAMGVVQQLLADDRLASAVAQLPEAWRRNVEEVFPGVGDQEYAEAAGALGDPSSRQIRLSEALRRALILMARARPLLISIDDSQWTDPSSNSFLHHLYRRPFPKGFMLLLASNPKDSRRLQREYGSVDTIELGSFSVSDIAGLLRHPSVSRDAESAESIYARTGGHPLLVSTVLAAESSDQPSVTIRSSAAELFRGQLERLSDESRLLLGSLTVIGGKAPLDVTIAVAGLESGRTGPSVMQLARNGLICIDEDGITATHRLPGEMVLADCPPVVRRLLHARAARYFRERGASAPAIIAIQHDIAGEAKEAYEAAIQAANASLRLSANREAEYFLKLALSHTEDHEQIAEVRLELARLYFKIGRAGQIPSVLHWDGWSQCTASKQLWKEVVETTLSLAAPVGTDHAIDEAWRSVRRANEMGEASAVAHLLTKIAPASSDIGRLHDARRAAYELVRLLPRLPKSETLRCRGVAAAVLSLTESVAKAKCLIEDMYESAHTSHDQIQYLGTSALIFYTEGNLKTAEARNLAGIALSERHGDYSLFVKLLNNLSVCYLEMGRYKDAKECLHRALEFSAGRHTEEGQTLLAYDNLSLIAYEEGEYERCLEFVEAAAELNRRVDSRRSFAAALGVRGLASLELGRLADAFECERELNTIDKKRAIYLSDMSYIEIFAARMHALRGNRALAQERLRSALEHYQDRDLFGRARLRVELLRLHDQPRAPDVVAAVRGLERELRNTEAQPLLNQVRNLLART